MSLKVYCGPMWSNKTTTMIHEINRLMDISSGLVNKSKALIINHQLDTRDPVNIVSSHSSLYKGMNENIDVVSTPQLSSIDVTPYNIIGVDEVNFFTDKDDLVTSITSWLHVNKHIIAVGLDGDSNMNKFGHISELVHLADTFVKLTAICTPCVNDIVNQNAMLNVNNLTPAPFTKKLIHNDLQVQVGGGDVYQCCCRKHHAL